MTIATTASKVTVIGNGSQTVFNYAFIIPDKADAQLWLTDLTGQHTLLGADQWSGTNFGQNAGGTFTYPVSGTPIASGVKLTLERTVPDTQDVRFANQQGFYPRSVETGLDRVEMQVQQLRAMMEQTLRIPVPEANISALPAASQRANGVLGFGVDGLPTILYDLDVGGLTPVGLSATGIILPIGADPTGVLDSSPALQTMLTYLKTNGGFGYIPPGNYKLNSAIDASDGVAFTLSGAGMGLTKLHRNAGYGTPLSINRCPNVVVQNLQIDCHQSTIPANGNQAFTALDCEDFTIRGCFFRDYLKSATLIYSSNPAAQKRNNFIIQCGFDGLDAAGNGFLLADVDYSGMRDCWGKGCYQNNPNGPGYAFQLKNTCKHSFIENCYAESCTAVCAFGNDNNLLGVTFSRVQGIRGKNFTAGFLAAYSENNLIQGLDFDATGQSNSRGVIIQDGCFHNVIDGVTVANLTGASSAAVLIRNGASWNTVDNLMIVNPQFARMVNFGTDSENNVVHIGNMDGGAAPDNPGAAMSDVGGSGTNMVEFRGSIAYIEPTYGPTTTTPMSYFFATNPRLGLFAQDESGGGICGGSPATTNFDWAVDYDFANRRLKLHARNKEAVRIQPTGDTADTRCDITPGVGSATAGVTVGGASGTATDVSLLLRAQGVGETALQAGTGSAKQVRVNNTGVGFFGTTPIAKPNITGSRAGNAALASLLTQLAALGLVTNSSTA